MHTYMKKDTDTILHKRVNIFLDLEKNIIILANRFFPKFNFLQKEIKTANCKIEYQ